MKKLFNLTTNRTLITHLFCPRTPEEEIAEVRGAEADGADAAAIELQKLPEQYRNATDFKRIIDSVQLPFMFILYRSDSLKWDDEKRMNTLMTAAEAGAGMIDVIGDLFYKSPDERTRNKEAIKRQMEAIEAIHATGSQVIMSSHPLRPMTADEVIDQLKDFEQRGADVVKIVTKVDTDEQFVESIRTTLKLHNELKTPFVHLCGGAFSRIQRFTGTALGSALTFAVHEYHDYAGYNQPKITAFKNVQNNMLWNINSIE